MNEDGTTAAAEPTAPADNINSDEGGVSADEVASVLHLPKAEGEEASTESEEPKPEAPETPADKTEPVEPEEPTKVTPEAPAPPEVPDTPSFTMEIEDANGKKFTISPDDNLEDVMAEFEPKNNGQVIQLIRELDKLASDKKTWEDKQASDKVEAERSELVASIQSGWDKEILKLQGDKRLPLDDKIEDRKQAVYKFMADENEQREADGRPLLQSFEDALDKLELREKKEADSKAARDAREETRRRGGLVGGSSAPATSGVPTYRAGSARNASEAIRSLGLLSN